MKTKNFFAELKRRRVYRVAVAYAIVSWLLIQIATQVFPFFEIPTWTVRLVIVLLALGFPIALLLAWAFDLTPEGIKRTDDLDELQQQDEAGNSRLIRATHIATAPEKSIAVLPFENYSDDVQNAYVADGIQDDILSSLAKVADLKVTSRTSVRQYKTGTRNLREIGEALGVAYILEGSVRRESNRVRINAQLIDARTDQHVWNDTYDREITDLFELQSELARRITFALRATCRRAKKPASRFIRPRTWLPMNFSCARAISFAGAARAIRAKMESRPFVCWTKRSAAIRTSRWPTVSFRVSMANSIGLDTTEVARVSPRRRSRPTTRSAFNPILATRVSPSPTIIISAIAITNLPGRRSPSRSRPRLTTPKCGTRPVLSIGARAAGRMQLRTLKRRASSIRETIP